MKHPDNLQLCGKRVVLTSYKPEHVPKYHDWMSDEEILRLTGSERLTLDEEYAMQQDWENDINKCTFIVLSKDLFDETKSEISSMIGDTNLFLNQSHVLENPGDSDVTGTAEIEVMIAENSFRRQGCAKEALQLIMEYAIANLNVNTFLAKIKADNEGSIQLFKNLGYLFQSKNEIFNEVCFSYVHK